MLRKPVFCFMACRVGGYLCELWRSHMDWRSCKLQPDLSSAMTMPLLQKYGESGTKLKRSPPDHQLLRIGDQVAGMLALLDSGTFAVEFVSIDP